jgi:3-mercaptopyruvate sulfurtransferase SseA
VANVIGGIVAWQQAGLPIEREEQDVAAGALASV